MLDNKVNSLTLTSPMAAETSQQIVAEMMDTLLSNQNTAQYGLVSTDGKWRDEEGKTLEDYGATSKGQFRGLSGFITFAKSI